MGRWGLAWLAAVAAVAAAVAAGSSATRLSRRPFSPPPKERRPNIVLIMTDDQDVELGSLNFMPRLLRHVRDGGAEFRHAYTTTPMCCPSRSSMLTGMYMHNHMVYTNNDNCSSPQWQATHETRSFATYLSNAGYRTGYFGKYLNKYNGSYIPPGWREWGGLIMNSRYYNYSINLNGKKIKHGDQYDKDYYPDLIANDSINFLRQSKQYFSRKPVMLVLGFPAPHGPEDSAPQYSKMFFNVTTHHTPSYDYAPNPDKQWILQVTGRMQPIHRQFTDLLMTKRLQTLQSVDVAVERIIDELKALGELDNTYIVYTSDHGYHLGQFGLVKGKSFPFEFDVRVPFLVRGPGIEPGTIVDEIVLNIDLAPTFLDIAGVEPPQHMDGRSILRLLNRKHRSRANTPPAKWPDTFLIESSGRRDIADTIATEVKLKESLKKLQRDLNVTLISAETDISYLSNTTSPTELGQNVTDDVLADGIPDEIKSVAKEAEDGQLDNQLLPVPAPGVSKLERLAMECQRPEYKPPCRPGQKWFCLSDGIRWRKHKCKIHANILPQPKVKKCACFTPTGHLYTRIEHDERRLQRDFVRNPVTTHEIREFRPKFVRDMRYKRDITEDEDERTNKMGPFDKYRPHIKIVGNRRRNRVDLVREEELETKAMESLEKLQSFFNSSQVEQAVDEAVLALREFNGVRNRRAVVGEASIDTEVNEMMGHLEKEIFGLQESNSRNTSVTIADPNCTIGKGGRIFCTEDIYSDPKAWKASRDLLEYQIKKLKTRLDKLKEIRRHLKEKRPLIAYDDSLEDDDEEKSSADMSIEGDASNATGTSTQRNRHRHHHSEARMKDILAHPPTPSPTIRSTYLGRGKGHVGVPPTRLDMAALDPTRTFGSQRPKQTYIPDTCYCEPDLPPYKDEKELAKEAKRKMKEDRMKKRERKLRRKAKFEVECLAERMNCFNHDNDHWKTPPFWNEGPFCFCMNANNNTYSCLRTINATHNFLYCEFITGLITYYNLRIDPFEQWNRINSLTIAEKSYLHNQLEILKSCRGVRQCTLGSSQPTSQSNKTRRRNYHTISFGSFYPPHHSFQHPPPFFRKKSSWRPWRRRHARNQMKPKKKHVLEYAREATVMKDK